MTTIGVMTIAAPAVTTGLPPATPLPAVALGTFAGPGLLVVGAVLVSVAAVLIAVQWVSVRHVDDRHLRLAV